MILVDTSIWIDHLRTGDPELGDLLREGQVLGHPWVTGELAVGNLSRREEILGLLHNLPQATVATDDEVLAFIDHRQLFGLGIGYVDAHLLAATACRPEPPSSCPTRTEGSSLRTHSPMPQCARSGYVVTRNHTAERPVPCGLRSPSPFSSLRTSRMVGSLIPGSAALTSEIAKTGAPCLKMCSRTRSAFVPPDLSAATPSANRA